MPATSDAAYDIHSRDNVDSAIVRAVDWEPTTTSILNPDLMSLFLLDVNQTGPVIVIYSKNNFSDNNTISDQLNSIKNNLGLNLSQLSKILDVSRPTLYKWLEDNVIPQKEESNQKIITINSFLNEIPKEHSKYFGKFSKRYISESTTVLDELASKDLDKEKFLKIYGAIKGDLIALEMKKEKLAKADQDKYNAANIILP